VKHFPQRTQRLPGKRRQKKKGINMAYLELLGYLAGLLTTFSASPQLYYSYTTKDVKSLNLTFMSMLIAGLSLWAVYGIVIKSLPIIIFNAIGVMLWIPLYWMKIMSKKKDDDNSK
jgi:MtN3 and saliva related transmembrane protein